MKDADIKAELRALRNDIMARPVLSRAGSQALPVTDGWVTARTEGGNTLNASSPTALGIKRTLTEAKPVGYIWMPVQARAIATISAGAVNTLTITGRGRAYASAPTVTIAPPVSGTQATASCTIDDNRSVLAAKITNCGSGYWDGASVAFAAPPSGTTAQGTAVIRLGKIVGITITNPGSGYTSAPGITVTPVSGGSGFAGTAIMDKGYVATISIVTAGDGYTTAPVVTIDAPSPFQPDPADLADGIGWATVLSAYQASGLKAGDIIIVANDNRSTVHFPLVASVVDGSITVQGSDTFISWAKTLLRLSDMDADADGILTAWVPMGGGE
jgi:hypothetical protein